MASLPNPSTKTPSSYWNKQSRRYDFAIQILNFELAKLVTEFTNLIPEGSKVLEAGCGTGLFTIAAATRAEHVIATDISRSMIEVTRQRLREHEVYNVHLETADAVSIDSFKGPFDVVVCANLLHLLNKPEEFLSKAMTRIKPGGLLIAPTFLHQENLFSQAASYLLKWSGFPLVHSFHRESYHILFANLGGRIKVSKVYGGVIPIYLVVIERDNV